MSAAAHGKHLLRDSCQTDDIVKQPANSSNISKDAMIDTCVESQVTHESKPRDMTVPNSHYDA